MISEKKWLCIKILLKCQNNLKELFLRHSDNERIMKIIKDKSKISLVE